MSDRSPYASNLVDPLTEVDIPDEVRRAVANRARELGKAGRSPREIRRHLLCEGHDCSEWQVISWLEARGVYWGPRK